MPANGMHAGVARARGATGVRALRLELNATLADIVLELNAALADIVQVCLHVLEAQEFKRDAFGQVIVDGVERSKLLWRMRGGRGTRPDHDTL